MTGERVDCPNKAPATVRGRYTCLRAIDARGGVESCYGGGAARVRPAGLFGALPAGSGLLPCWDFVLEDDAALLSFAALRGLHCGDGKQSHFGIYFYGREFA